MSHQEILTKAALGVVLTLCVAVGSPLVGGIIHFEKYGSDPFKRNLIDMVRHCSMD